MTVGRIESVSLLADPKARGENNLTISKINEIVNASAKQPPACYTFPQNALSESPSTTLTESTVFGDTIVSGGTNLRIVTRGMGNFTTKLYDSGTYINGATFSHESVAEETQYSDWISTSYSEDRKIKPYFQARAKSWDFNDNNIADWTIIESGSQTNFAAASGKVNGTNTSTNKLRAVLYAPAVYNQTTPTITCKVKQNDNNAGYFGGIAYNIVDINNFYYFQITTDNIHLGHWAAGILVDDALAALALPYNNYYTLRLEVTPKGVATAYVNGVLKLTKDYGAIFTTARPTGLYYFNNVATANLDIDYDDYVLGAGSVIYGVQVLVK